MKYSIVLVVATALCVGRLGAAERTTTKETLDTIILPKVQFEDASLRAVFTYLKQRSKDLDPEGKGVNFVLRLDPPAKTKPPADGKADGKAEKRSADDDPFADAVGESAPAPTAEPIADSSVTMDFDNVPLGELIRYVCKASGLKYRIEKHAVIIAGPNVALDRMETRIYPVGPGFLNPKRTR